MNYESLHLEPNEHVVYEVRKHWVIFLGYATSLLFLAVLPFLVFSALHSFLPQLEIDISTGFYSLFFFFYCLWLLTLWIIFFLDWTKYYLDVWYVTEKRIIIVEQRQLFDRQVANIRFDRVQDVTVSVDGFIATFLDFGNIKVQTASEDSNEFSMSSVKHPIKAREIIFAKHNSISDSIDFRKPY